MRLSEQQRELIERALDAQALCLATGQRPTVGETRLYQRAIAIVRELPAGARRMRSDFLSKRPTPQTELPIESDTARTTP